MAQSIQSFISAGIGTSTVAVGGFTAAAVTTGTVLVALTVANTTVGTVHASVLISNGATQGYICKNATLLAGGTLAFGGDALRHALNPGYQVIVFSDTANSLDAILSVSVIQ